ncbi:hypothetical protein D3C87_1995700 [compost metagenome]
MRGTFSLSCQQLLFRFDILSCNIEISVRLRNTDDVIKRIVRITVISNQVAIVSDRKTLLKSVRDNDNLLT